MDLNDAWTMRSIHVDARYIVPQACSMIPVRGRVHPHLGNRAARWCVSAESRRPLCVHAGIDDPLQGLTIVAMRLSGNALALSAQQTFDRGRERSDLSDEIVPQFDQALPV